MRIRYNITEDTQIQIISLIDVVFCILTFFLLASLQLGRQRSIDLDLPKATTSNVVSNPTQVNNIIVTLDAVGNLYIEKQLVTKEELKKNLQQYIQGNPNGSLVLNASRTTTYNDVVAILDLMREVGGDRVSLGIIPGPPSLIAEPGNIILPEINQGIPITPGLPPLPSELAPVPTPNPNSIP